MVFLPVGLSFRRNSRYPENKGSRFSKPSGFIKHYQARRKNKSRGGEQVRNTAILRLHKSCSPHTPAYAEEEFVGLSLYSFDLKKKDGERRPLSCLLVRSARIEGKRYARPMETKEEADSPFVRGVRFFLSNSFPFCGSVRTSHVFFCFS